jgi:ABC-type sugar transport system ATPase subunit
MPSIALRNVTRRYPGGHEAVRALTLEIEDGELMVVVGPSGSGKSTVLRLIAGLDAPTSGTISIGGRDVTVLPPQQRDIAMVFQSYALYPHKTVRDNLAFGLRVRGVDRERIAVRVRDAAALLGIAGLLDRKPAQLSGGQRQRVALGRAIVREPQAFLLDEPLSNLDPVLRTATRARAELALLHRRLAATMVYVTHDQEEAMTLGTRIAVMHDGRLEQVGPPLKVYERPANAFVGGFVGAPTMNLWPARAERDGGNARLVSAAFAIDAAPTRTGPVVDAVLVGIRPHDVDLTGDEQADLRGRVDLVEPLGATTLIHLRVDGLADLVRVQTGSECRIAAGDRRGLRLRRERLHVFDARSGRRLVEWDE